jgi:hypothetical protein
MSLVTAKLYGIPRDIILRAESLGSEFDATCRSTPVISTKKLKKIIPKTVVTEAVVTPFNEVHLEVLTH